MASNFRGGRSQSTRRELKKTTTEKPASHYISEAVFKLYNPFVLLQVLQHVFHYSFMILSVKMKYIQCTLKDIVFIAGVLFLIFLCFVIYVPPLSNQICLTCYHYKQRNPKTPFV